MTGDDARENRRTHGFPSRAAARRRVALWLVVVPLALTALAGCLGGSGALEPVSATTGSGDGTAPDPQYPMNGTEFEWNVTGGPTYFAVAVKVQRSTNYKNTFYQEATWNKTRAYLTTRQRWSDWSADGEHTPAIAGFYFQHQTSCLTGDADPDQPEDCPRRNWSSEPGEASMGGTLFPGTHLIWQAVYGADTASLRMRLETFEPVEVLWTEEGSTRLIELEDRDATATYPQGAVQFHANASVDEADPYFGTLMFVGSEIRRGPSYEVRGPQSFDFIRDPRVRPGTFGGFYYYGPETDLLPGRVPFAQFSAQAGEWNVRAHGGVRSPSGAGIPLLGIVEDPRFVDDEGLIVRPD